MPFENGIEVENYIEASGPSVSPHIGLRLASATCPKTIDVVRNNLKASQAPNSRRRWTRRPAAIVLSVGLVSVLAGVALYVTSLAPYFGLGPDPSTVASPERAELPPFGDLSVGTVLPNTASAASEAAATLLDRPVNGVAFEMMIPALGYSATVYEGVDKDTLLKGPGHYPDTVFPGRAGLVGIAGHNTSWLGFNRLKPGDRVQLKSRRGLFIYEITGSRVVNADDRTILVQTSAQRLVLTTCWPLWAGAFATQRLVFFATLT